MPTPTGTPLPVADRPRRPDRPRHQAEAQGHADARRQRQARRAEPQPGRLRPGRLRRSRRATRSSRPATSTARSSSPSSSARPRRRPRGKVPGRAIDGTPTLDNPTFSLAQPGAAPIGVPNFFIDKFRIPPFLLPLYQAAGIEYGVRWEVLAAINEIETDYGRNLNVSTAGAARAGCSSCPRRGSSTASTPTRTASRIPYNPADAIFATARYLKAAGAEQDLRKAIFAYNHADWYVDSVLMRARLIGGLPSNFVGSLTGLTQGHFPVAAKATYADDFTEADAKKAKKRSRKLGNRALVVRGFAAPPRDQDLRPPRRAGRRRQRRQDRPRRRRQAPRQASSSSRTPTATPTRTRAWRRSARATRRRRLRTTTQKQVAKELALPAKDAAPTAPASSTTKKATKRTAREAAPNRHAEARQDRQARHRRRRRSPTKQRLFAHPQRPNAGARRRRAAGVRAHRQDRRQLRASRATSRKVFGLDRKDVRIKRLRPGAHVVAGTILGRIGKVDARQGPAHAVRDPPGRPRRPADRPEADPRRLEAARVDRDLPRRRQEPVLRPRRQAADDRPDPADEQGGAGPARARQPAHRGLLVRAPATSAPARSTAACWPRSSSSPPPACGRRSRRSSAATAA